MTTVLQRPGIEQLRPLLGRLTGDEKHELSAESTVDVIWVLYDRVLRVDPDHPDAPDRDRFLLSKGHGPHAYYAVLAAKRFFPTAWLDDLAGLAHVPHRLLALGVGRTDLRRYGSPADHARWHGLDPAGLRRALTTGSPPACAGYNREHDVAMLI